MQKVRSFQELTVWQPAIDLAVEVYALTRAFPKAELFRLTSQLRRAAVSVSSNIAEGQGRVSRRDFFQFLAIARGSNAEVRSQLVISRRLNIGDEALSLHCDTFAIEISKMLNALSPP